MAPPRRRPVQASVRTTMPYRRRRVPCLARMSGRARSCITVDHSFTGRTQLRATRFGSMGVPVTSLHYTRDIPVSDATDVLVVGGGPAGIAAAVAAARAGASVRIVERFGFLGGNLTAGLVGPCMTSFSLDGKIQLVRGVFDEFVRRMEAVGGAVHPSRTRAGSQYSGFMVFGHEAVTPFDPEVAKQTALEMCVEAGVELLLHSFVVDAVTTDGRVTGVVVANKSGLTLVPATVT